MGKIIQAIKRFIWPEDDKKQEEEATAKPVFSPYIRDMQRVYIRGLDSIVFACKNHPQLLEFKIKAENGTAFADISYINDMLHTRLNDGHFNADNGTVLVDKIGQWLVIKWILGTSVKLGNWKVELAAIGKETTEKDVKWIEIWEKNNDAVAQGSYKVSLNRIETAWC